MARRRRASPSSSRASATGLLPLRRKRVVTIKPGFVDGDDLRAAWDVPGRVPQDAARRIVAAVEKGKDQAYVPGFWRFVMLAIRLLPERIFKRMRL
jgi:hypothetical protein